MNRQTIGQAAEDYACSFLLKKAYQLRERNFHCKLGEIDLIMLSPTHELVFVEVRWRKNHSFGGPLASITPQKQYKIAKTASYYLQQHGLDNQACRFDVIAIVGANKPANLEWIRDAFQV